MSFEATLMDPEANILSQTEKDKYHDITYMWNLKYDTNELIYEAEIDSQTYRTASWLPRRTGEGRDTVGI